MERFSQDEQDEYERGEAGLRTRYEYTAKNMAGEVFRGTAAAENYDALYTQLRGRGLYLQSAVRREKKRGRRFKAKELSGFCQELAGLLEAGINLVRALTIVAQEETLSAKQAAIYESIVDEVRAGAGLSAAMERQDVFPDLMLGMIRSAEGNGNLDVIAARLAVHYTREHKLRQQIRSAMTYPCILAVMALIALVVIFTFILPSFQELFDGMETLPAVTAALMAVSDFLVNRWYAALGGAAVLAALVYVLRRVPAVRFRLDRWKLKTRFLGIGRLTSAMCTVRLARTICSLYSCGVPLVPALQTACGTVGNRFLASQIGGVIDQVCGGAALSDALRSVDGLRGKLCDAVQVGERTGKLDEALDSIADAVEYDSSEASKRLITFLEPGMIIFMALIIGVIMIGVMYPIIGSYSAIGSVY